MNALLRSLIQFLYPAQCRHCEENLDPADGHYICKSCWEEVRFIEEPFCQTCGYPLSFARSFERDKSTDVWFRKSRSIAHYYDDNIVMDEKMDLIGNFYSCSNCPKDAKPSFSLSLEFQIDLNGNNLSVIRRFFARLKNFVFQQHWADNIKSDRLLSEFIVNRYSLSDKAIIFIEQKNYGWRIKDKQQEYIIRKEDNRLNVYQIKIRPKATDDKDDLDEKNYSVVANSIHLLKYNDKTVMAEYLANLMIESFPKLFDLKDYDLIIPLPMHIKKQRKRGYNQVELIGRILSKSIGIPLDTKSLVKIINTDSQVGSSVRSVNLKGAFDIIEPSNLEGKRILFIDDVMTTGSSVNEPVKILMKKGKVKYVDVYTLVRAVSSPTYLAIKAAGQFHSGKTDLSENHDEYLAEVYKK
jgi:ComF family protein